MKDAETNIKPMKNKTTRELPQSGFGSIPSECANMERKMQNRPSVKSREGVVWSEILVCGMKRFYQKATGRTEFPEKVCMQTMSGSLLPAPSPAQDSLAKRGRGRRLER